MLGEFTREDEANGGLDLPCGHGLLLVIAAELAGFGSDAVEGVPDEGVEDGHGSLGDSGVRVDLLEDAVDVDVVGLPSLSATSCGATGWHGGRFFYLLDLATSTMVGLAKWTLLVNTGGLIAGSKGVGWVI